jgi:hypothetical protein
MVKGTAEITLLVMAIAGSIGGIWTRLKQSKGIAVRFLQYLGLTVLVPIIALLSMEGSISQEMTGAIAAAAVGGVLASIGKDE